MVLIGNDVDVRVVPLRADEDVVRMRQLVREFLVSVGFSLIDQTKMITAASELGRNTLRYGGRIWIEDGTEGRGTRFLVALPSADGCAKDA